MTGSIPLIRSRDIAREIQGSKGLLVVQLTSFETSCSFCIRSNPVFEEVAKDPANAKVRFLRVAYLPWTQMGSDAFAQTFAYSGLPIYAVYKDGNFIRKHGGHAEQMELQQLLFSGLE